MQIRRVHAPAVPVEIEAAAPAHPIAAPVAIEAEAVAGAMLELVEQGAVRRARVVSAASQIPAAPVWSAPAHTPERRRLDRRFGVALAVATASPIAATVSGFATIFTSPSTALILGGAACGCLLVTLAAGCAIVMAMRGRRDTPLAIGDWHDALQLPEPRYARVEPVSERLRAFSTWLDKLREAGDYLNVSTRQAFLTRVRNLLSAITADPNLRERVLDIATEASTACGDRTAWGLNAMEMAVLTRRAERGELSEQALFELGRGSFRLDALGRIASAELAARRSAGGQMRHEPEVLLELQSSLREQLGLPVGNQVVRFSSQLGSEDIAHAHAAVLAEEQALNANGALIDITRQGLALYEKPAQLLPALEKHPLGLYLARNFRPWAEQVARDDPAGVAEIKRAAQDYLERLEDAHTEAGVSEAEYVSAANEAGFLHDHGPAYRRALELLAAAPETAHRG